MKRMGLICCLLLLCTFWGSTQTAKPSFHYSVDFPEAGQHRYQVTLDCSHWPKDSIELKMPNWMPGYYQLMDYGNTVQKIIAKSNNKQNLTVTKRNASTWVIKGIKQQNFSVSYQIQTSKQFVANSYVDSAHAYLIPGNSFFYVDGYLNQPVSVSVHPKKDWSKIATGLEPISNKTSEFSATNFDILYDCPILTGNLIELPSFKVRGIEHRFIGYKMDQFNQIAFMNHLKKIVEAAVNIIGHIPYKQYTFIGIGPGRGGIEHLNNTTISFDGKGLEEPEGMNRMMNFIAHEYFHHYNVKRIRPFELGPFDYEKGNRTNLLWISEGLSVYYEYLIVKRAGLSTEKMLLDNFSGNINAHENNPGKNFQSLQQASYATWSDGPFGNAGNEPGKSISYYDKGPLVGLLLDFEIRHVTKNQSSLDDVMRKLYWDYYIKANRGFTESEFQQTCESIAGKPLQGFFEYVYSNKELNYQQYLDYAGLQLNRTTINSEEKKSKIKFNITPKKEIDSLQSSIYLSWLGITK